MKIETRYDVGDKVWPLLQVLTGGLHWEPWRESGIISAISIFVDTPPLSINYVIMAHGGRKYGRPEAGVFPTKELAQAECDRRNAEAKEQADG